MSATAALAVINGALDGVARGRIQAVADLTALAAAHHDDSAREVADHNGARLQSIQRVDDVVVVVVTMDGRRSIAAATLDALASHEHGLAPPDQ